jgi:UDP-glucose 4-epimerase
MLVLVTGGCGYIGSHACVALLEAGYEVVVVDNLCNGSRVALERARQLGGGDIAFLDIDIRDSVALEQGLAGYKIDGVLHFAGLKSPGESLQEPERYYDNNVEGSESLFNVLQDIGVDTIVFSSSATVYGLTDEVPVSEKAPYRPGNPYGENKMAVELALQERAKRAGWRVSLLRYFNPVGAHPSGQIGESPRGIPCNLVPYLTQVAVGKRDELTVFGDDYATPDGTGVRDFIHVMDLVHGHLKALDWLVTQPAGTVEAFNLGTGRGHSVLELVREFTDQTGIEIPYRISGRRHGDIGESYADVSKARHYMGWEAHYGLGDMLCHAWKWQQQNPEGYPDTEA